jgi:histidinol dehydrogenase
MTYRAARRECRRRFVGDWTAQVAGDYAIGSNHVLPRRRPVSRRP